MLSLTSSSEQASGAFIIALNRQGEVAWFFRSPENLGLLKKSRRGNILTNNQKDKVLELDLTGKILQRFSEETYAQGLQLFFQKNENNSAKGQNRFLSQKLKVTQNILKAERQENTTAYTLVQEWTDTPDPEKIFELEISDEYKLQGILHLPDLLLHTF